MKTEAISTGAQPTPMSAIAVITIQGWVAKAKRNAPPPPPMASRTAAVRLGPYLSRHTPTTNCIAENDANHAPEASERSVLVAPSSEPRTGVRTARKER